MYQTEVVSIRHVPKPQPNFLAGSCMNFFYMYQAYGSILLKRNDPAIRTSFDSLWQGGGNFMIALT